MKSEKNTDFFDPNEIDNRFDDQIADNRVDTSGADKILSSRAKNNIKSKRRDSSIIRFVKDRRTRIFAGICFICISTYLFISAISYFFIGAADQSAAMNLSVLQMVEQGNVHNSGGALGASFSHNFIADGLGLGALIIIGYFFILGWRLLHRRPAGFIGLTFKSLLLAITVSLVVGLATYDMKSWLLWGGVHGYEINSYLMRLLGLYGAILVSVCLVGAIIAIYFNELRLIYLKYRRKAIARANKKREIEEYKANRKAVADEGLHKSDVTLDKSNGIESAPTHIVEQPTLGFDEGFLGSKISATVENPEINSPESSDKSLFDGTTTASVAYNDEHVDDDVSDINSEAEITVNVNEVEEATHVDNELFDPSATLSHYVPPSLDLLTDSQLRGTTVDQEEMEKNKARITETLGKYDIPIVRIEATVGPTVTLYEIVPDDGVRIAKVKRLEDDIAMSLSAKGIRIIAPIPGKGSIGIEVPNEERQMVPARTVFGSRRFQECNNMELPLAMGATIARDIYIDDLAKMPHLLVAGATGTGKSVGLNIIIASLMFKKHPSQLKFVLIDPKMVEFSLYGKLDRHFLAMLPDEDEPVITDPGKAAATLNSLCVEMDNRYKLLKNAGVRNIKEYNEEFVHRRLLPSDGHFYMPYIVVVVDEFGDLFMLAGKEVETPIARLAQKARAVGIHMILATQRPSADIVKGFIRANFPARMAFQVASRIDSMTILDRPGAQGLIGRGDMLCSNLSEIERVQCAFISTDEVKDMVEHVANQVGYIEPYTLPPYSPNGDSSLDSASGVVSSRDPLFDEAARFIVMAGTTASTSMLQRRYSIGYNRAGKIMDQMEQSGIVGPALGSKPRSVLMDPLQLERFLEIPLAQ